MPELPDITIYMEALERRLVGTVLEEVRLNTPFLLRTVDPPLDALVGKHVRGIERLGKRIVLVFDEDLFMVLHLMIAGRLHWEPRSSKMGKVELAAWIFENGI